MEKPIAGSEQHQRHLALEGSYNIRDVGGYVTLNGRSIRWKTLLRADNLSHLSPASQQLLLAYPVRTIIDLRRTSEVSKLPGIFAQSTGVNYINISLLEDERKVIQAQSLQTLYRLILEISRAQIKLVVQTIAQQGVYPCIAHCTAGKDRTGLIIALLLSIGKVPAYTIARDYALSGQYLDPLFNKLRVQAEQDENAIPLLSWLMEARQETMLETLTYLDEQFGSVRGYLMSIGITEEQMDTIYEALVE